jgi:hypothetical protein
MIRSHGLDPARRGSVIDDCRPARSAAACTHAAPQAAIHIRSYTLPCRHGSQKHHPALTSHGAYSIGLHATASVIGGIDLDQSLTDDDGSTDWPLCSVRRSLGPTWPGGGGSLNAAARTQDHSRAALPHAEGVTTRSVQNCTLRRVQWTVSGGRGFFGKAATSWFSQMTAPGVWCQAGPQSLT